MPEEKFFKIFLNTLQISGHAKFSKENYNQYAIYNIIIATRNIKRFTEDDIL